MWRWLVNSNVFNNMICTYKQLPMQDGRSTGISEKKNKETKRTKIKEKKSGTNVLTYITEFLYD